VWRRERQVRGRRAYLAGELDVDDEEELLVFCPGCARREFDSFGWQLRD
jgi:hypothetical protein